jgi:hypothetical protein
MVKCAFCEKNVATHFNTDWDAELCDECADEQDRLIRAEKDTKLTDLFPGLEGD